MGSKNPKIILDNQDFLLTKKMPDKTIWRCSQYYYAKEIRCKTNLITSGRIVTMNGQHNHEINLKNHFKFRSMVPQKVTVIRGKK